MVELIDGDLTYKIIGAAYKVYNTLGPGFQEKYYQKSLAKVFQKQNLPYLEQVRVEMDIDGISLGRYYIDFVIEHRIVLEIKAKNSFSQKDIKQVLAYLKKANIKVGLLIAFATEGIKIKRILKGRD